MLLRPHVSLAATFGMMTGMRATTVVTLAGTRRGGVTDCPASDMLACGMLGGRGRWEARGGTTACVNDL